MRLGLLAGYCRRGMQPYPMGPAEPGKLDLGDSGSSWDADGQEGQMSWQRAQAVAGNAGLVRRVKPSASISTVWGEGKDHV